MFVAIVQRPDNGAVLPIVVGGDGPDSECMAQFPTRAAAEDAMANTMAAMAWGYTIIDLDECV